MCFTLSVLLKSSFDESKSLNLKISRFKPLKSFAFKINELREKIDKIIILKKVPKTLDFVILRFVLIRFIVLGNLFMFVRNSIYIIIFLIVSCSNNLDNKNVGVSFIGIDNNIPVSSNDKIKLSTSYYENNNLICIYIKDDTKIIKEVSKNEDCLPEI